MLWYIKGEKGSNGISIMTISEFTSVWFNRSHRDGYATICGNLFILSLSSLVGHFFGHLPLTEIQVNQLEFVSFFLLVFVHVLRKG